MFNLYVVMRAGSFSRDAVDMPSLREYYYLYGFLYRLKARPHYAPQYGTKQVGLNST